MQEEYFKAEDIYSNWLSYCNESKISLVVISPYVDNTVRELLTSNTISKGVKKQIYTRIDSDTIFEKPYQIRALINCKKAGIEIYHIAELHSKTLIVDSKYISIGSQNFTSRGRKSKETSFLSDLDLSSSHFLSKIQKWLANAKPIDLNYLLELERNLKYFRKNILKLRIDHQDAFNEISEIDKDRKKRELTQNIQKLKSKTETQFESEYIYLSFTTLWTIVPPFSTYFADASQNLKKWKTKGTNKTTYLVRLNYYPCLLMANNSIAFVRLSQTRISFYLTRIILGRLSVGDKNYLLSINCPQENTYEVNFQIQLESKQTGLNTINLLFNGLNFQYMNGEFSNREEKEFIIKEIFQNDEIKQKLIQRCLKAHNIGALGRSITGFFKKLHYKLYVVDYEKNSILIAE